MKKQLFLLSLMSVSAFAQTNSPNAVHTGFYKVSDGTVVYVYSDLVQTPKEMKDSNSTSPTSGIFAVGKTGALFVSKLGDSHEVNLLSKDGPVKINSITPSEINLDFYSSNNTQAEHKTLSFLGDTEASAAQALALTQNFPVTDYLSHRGAAELRSLPSDSVYPGNTLKAMELAIENGYSGFEFDIQLTKDGQFAVSHDEQISASTNCNGKVGDYNLEDVMKCVVQYTGFLPEKRIFHTRATLSETVPSLENVLQTFVNDPRVRHLTLDTKPNDTALQVKAFDLLLKNISVENQGKLIFLIRDLTIRDQLRALGYTAPIYALEGSSGYEELETGELPPGADAISLSLGLGLTLAGFKSGNVATELQVVWSGIGSMVKGINPFNKNHWRSWTIDMGISHWSKRNQKRFLSLMNTVRAQQVKVIGWTVNEADKIQWLRQNAPDLPYIISDLPFHKIAQIEASELNDALNSTAQDALAQQ
jgi:glycerophosphoryl diester phosphodiesterase